MSASGELHSYIHGVLERGDHGPHRTIAFDAPALNAAIETHATGIGQIPTPQPCSIVLCDWCTPFEAKHIEPHVKRSVGRGPDEEVTVQNDLGNISFKAEVVTPKSLDDLVKIMAKANGENASAKAVGSLRSFSLVCPPRLSSL
jgi:hypothetical protein